MTKIDIATIDWKNLQAMTVDSFTVEEILDMLAQSEATARCSECEDIQTVEPDAREVACPSCGAIDTVTSPLVKLGLI